MIRVLFNIVRIKLISLAVLALLLVSVYVLALRIASFYLEDYRQDLESYLSSLSGQRVEILRLGSAWRGLDPTLNIHGLSINGREHAYVGRIKIQIAFFDSLLNLHPTLKEIVIEHTELSMQQFSDGSWLFASNAIDLENLFGSSSSTKLDLGGFDLEKFLDRAQIYLSDLTVSLHNNSGLVQSLRIPSTSVNYDNNNVYVSGSIRESDGASALLSFSLEGRGLIGEEAMKTDVYVEARSAEFFGKLLQVYSWEKISIDDVSASIRAWLSFDGASLTTLQGDLQLLEMNWRAGSASAPPIKNLAFDYYWQGNNAGEDQLNFSGLNFSWLGRVCSTDAIKVINGEDGINVAASELDIFCLSQLAVASGVLPLGLHDRLDISRPEGLLRNVLISIPRKESREGFSLEAMLEQVSLEAYDGTPSGMGIDGYLYADALGGYVSFSSAGFELGFPELFLESWRMKKAEGFVAWDIEGESIDVYSDGLRLWQQDGGLVYGDFILSLNAQAHEDYLDLEIGMQNLTVPSAPNFVPYHIVGADLHHWLVDSLQGGLITSGVYLGLGSVESNNALNSFTSSIDLNSDDLVLKFDPVWPPVQELDANIFLQNGKLDVNTSHARIADTRLKSVHASMHEPEGDVSSMLRIESKALADSKTLDYWLRDSPIASNTKEISEQLQVVGEFEVDVLLDIPVSEGSDKAELGYLIRSHLDKVDVYHKDSGVELLDATGVLDVSSKDGVSAENISVQAFGEPGILSISTSFDQTTYDSFIANDESDDFNELNQTNISLSGSTKVETVFNFFGYDTTAFIEGNIDYAAQLYIPNHDKSNPVLEISSDLAGVTRNWPAPLNKEKGVSEKFVTKLQLKHEEMLVISSLSLEDKFLLESELLFLGGAFSFGEVSLNGASMKQPSLNGLNVAVMTDEAELDPWFSFINQLTGLPWHNAQEKKDDNKDVLGKLELQFGQADIFGQAFHNAYVDISKKEQSWQIQINGDDIQGRVEVPHDGSAVGLNFETLSIQSNREEGGEQKERDLHPADLRDAQLSVANLLLDNRSIGSWGATLSVSPSTASVTNILGKFGGSSFEARLDWTALESGEQVSQLNLKSGGTRFEHVFQVVGFDPLVSSDNYSALMNLTWPGTPLDFSLGSLSGNLDLALQDGFMQTDDQKTGVLRLFGVLNAEAIMRRLELDFSDLYKSGVGFDSFDVTATIDKGFLSLTDPLVVDGPAGKYTINGTSDLASKAMDFDMLVELPFAQNVPLAALVLGAPQIGGIVWLADKLLGEPLSALTTSRYDISGTWEKPVVKLQSAVGAKKKKR